MKEAILYKKENGKVVQCFACSHRCVIPSGHVGVCRVRKNNDGKLFSLVYGKLIAQHIDPIEKKPLYHFLSGTLTYSIATVGCNFKCKHCQNADIAQYFEINDPDEWVPGAKTTPNEVVAEALEHDCPSISYTYTEPTVFIEFALETMKMARRRGLKNVWVTNGYFTEETFNLIKPHLDATNVDLKFFNKQSYLNVCAARLEPVLETIRRLVKNKIHIEVTTLIIPGLNDSDGELAEIAKFLAGLDKQIPWHLSAFYPAYQMRHISPTPLGSLNRAKKIGIEAGLANVHLGNV